MSRIFRPSLWVPFICCISITAFAEDGNFFTRLDQDIFDAIYDAPPQREPLGTIMEWGTEFGDSKAIMGLSILLMAYGDDAHRETGRLMSSAFIGTGMVVLGMKEIIRRKRPLDDQVGDPAFPSGHTAFAFAGATILADRYPKLRIPLYIGAGLVGVSRIYLGRHYVSDVVGGAAVGTITGMLVLHHRVTLLRWEF
jgi:undecaprenyl-diphosphatase